jgi:hypothetical protein
LWVHSQSDSWFVWKSFRDKFYEKR